MLLSSARRAALPDLCINDFSLGRQYRAYVVALRFDRIRPVQARAMAIKLKTR